MSFSLSADVSHTTLATVARCIARGLEAEYGIDASAVLQSAGFASGALSTDEQRIPLPDFSQLWALCVKLTAEEQFGLRIARHIAPADLYGIDLALYASATLGEAVQRFAQLLVLLTTATEGRVQRDCNGDWVLSYHLKSGGEPSAPARDFFIYAQIHLFERQCQMTARRFLRRIELTRAHPVDPTPWQALGVPIHFGRGHASMVFHADIWDKPILGTNAKLLAQVEQPILRQLARLGAPLPLSALRTRLIDRLDRPLSLEQFAADLGISPQSLEQSLGQQHVTFSQLLDQTREAQTLHLLAMPGLSLAQIASRVGYSKVSSLIRAFRRWKAMTPLAYRKALFKH
ncbi:MULTISPECIES: AraC family transcriptional regulator [unclassified Pseudomonas]|uniref:AraC family transcriptional regulator n=1 Tax=unclassified Pseudomonas TaxID=196821 RepID=UPI00111C4E29|nr:MULTISPECIES: AraC family transcriptional regulator [unclassified Pseudomonas]